MITKKPIYFLDEFKRPVMFALPKQKPHDKQKFGPRVAIQAGMEVEIVGGNREQYYVRFDIDCKYEKIFKDILEKGCM